MSQIINMKTISNNRYLPVIIIAALVLFVAGCKKDDPEPEVTPLLDVSLSSLDFTNTGEAKTFAITSNGDWAIASDQTWCAFSQSSGKGDATITVTIPANTSLDVRSATLTVTGKAPAKTVTVRQLGETPAMLVNTNNRFVESGEGNIAIEITTNVPYKVDISGEWLTPAAAGMSVKTIVTSQKDFTYGANTGLTPRTATVTFQQEGGALSESVKVSQLPEEPNKQMEAVVKNSLVGSGSNLLAVTTSDEISQTIVVEDAAWVNVVPAATPSAKAVGGKVRLLVDRNDSDIRTAKVVMLQTGRKDTLVITQVGENTAMVKVTFANLHAKAKNMTVSYADGKTWDAMVAADKSIQLPAVPGKLTAAHFMHADDNVTVVDWWNSAAGVELNEEKTIDLKGYAGGSGTEADPWLVANPRQLNNIRNVTVVNNFYKQIADIDLTDACGIYPNSDHTGFDDSKNNPDAPFYNNGKGWRAIDWSFRFSSDSRDHFYGYDGDNHKIIGLKNNMNGYNDNGALWSTFTGTLSNLTMDETSLVIGVYAAAAFVASTSYNVSAPPVIRIENCHNKATIILDKYNTDIGIGGIAGRIYGTSLVQCSNSGKLIAREAAGATNIGGIVGRDVAYVKKSVIEKCTNSSDLAQTSKGGNIGGIVAISGGGNIIDCINTGKITVTGSQIGGIVGSIDGGEISGCENKGVIVGEQASYCGGIAGYVLNDATVEDCVNNGEINLGDKGNPNSYIGGIAGCVTNFKGWLRNCTNTANVTRTLQESFCHVGGIVGDYAGRDGTFFLNCTNSGNITGYACVGGIGGYIYGPMTKCKNSGKITGTGSDDWNYNNVGGIAGQGLFWDGDGMTDCHNTGEVSGGYNAGGVIGLFWVGVIRQVSNTGKVSGDRCAGGITGSTTAQANKCILRESFNTADVHGQYAGGIVGYTIMPQSQLFDCYNSGNVSHFEGLKALIAAGPLGCSGGLVGGFAGGTIDYNYNCGNQQDGIAWAGYVVKTNARNIGVHNYNISTLGVSYSALDLNWEPLYKDPKSQAMVDVLNDAQDTPKWKMDTQSINNGYPVLGWQ